MTDDGIIYEVAGTRERFSLFLVKSNGNYFLRSARKWKGENPPLPIWDGEVNLGKNLLYVMSMLEELGRGSHG